MRAFIMCISLAHCLYGQVIPISPEPVGSGARALGQSAFIAVADDATAASWNPAGLINLEEPEASFVGAYKTTTSDLSSVDSYTAYHGGSWSSPQVNFMSYAFPLEIWGTDAVVSVNYHQVYDLGVELSIVDTELDEVNRQGSEGALSAYSVAGALSWPSHPEVTIGASFNWYAQSLLNDYARRATEKKYPIGQTEPDSTTNETLDHVYGYNLSFGLLWDMYEKEENLLTLGLVCHTPFTAEMRRTLVHTTTKEPKVNDIDIDFPLSLGAGVNYRFSDWLSGAFDVQWTNWSEYWYTNATSTPSDDVVAARLGFERLWFSEPSRESVFAWRGGVFYEPRPVWDDVLPVYGFSLGLGWTVKERFSLDFAYQFRWGDDDLTVRGTDVQYGVEEHLLIGSVITYF